MRLVNMREGISVDPYELAQMVKLFRSLILKGYSFEAIYATKGLPVSARTLYRYANAGIFEIANIDFTRKVCYKARKNPLHGRLSDG